MNTTFGPAERVPESQRLTLPTPPPLEAILAARLSDRRVDPAPATVRRPNVLGTVGAYMIINEEAIERLKARRRERRAAIGGGGDASARTTRH